MRGSIQLRGSPIEIDRSILYYRRALIEGFTLVLDRSSMWLEWGYVAGSASRSRASRPLPSWAGPCCCSVRARAHFVYFSPAGKEARIKRLAGRVAEERTKGNSLVSDGVGRFVPFLLFASVWYVFMFM